MKNKREPDYRRKPLSYRCKRIPKVGEEIYVRTSLYLSHGADDFCGGLAKISEVIVDISGGEDCIFISVEERPGHGYNWTFLEEEQEELKALHGKDRAHEDPDDRPEFNRWD